MTRISISICPTELECGDGATLRDEEKTLEAIRQFALAAYPDAKFTTLQVGYRQGDSWSRVNGDEDVGGELIDAFWDSHGSDESLYLS